MSSEQLTKTPNNLEKLYGIEIEKEDTLDSVESKSTTKVKEEKPTVPKNNLETLYESAEAPTISNLEKLDYGWDKTTNVVGNVYRIGKAQFQDWLDPDKDFEDYILQNEKKRVSDFNKEHWKFVGNKEAQKGGLVLTGEVLTYLTDPYYLLGYYFGSPALVNPVSSAALNAVLIGGDNAISQLAKKGKIDFGEVGKSAAIGGTIGAILPVGAKIVKRFLPEATNKQVKFVSDWLDNKIARKNNLSVKELKAIQVASNNKAVTNVQDKITRWNVNFVAPIVNEEKIFRTAQNKLLEKRNQLIKLRTATKGTKPVKGQFPGVLKQKSAGKQIMEIRQQIIDLRNKSNEVKKNLLQKQQSKLDKWSKLIAERDTKILEALKKSQGPVDKAVTALTSAIVRPLVGAAGGTTLGILFGPDETDLLYWAAGGAAVGQMQKLIQRSKVFTGGEKGKLLGLIDKNMASLTMQKIRSLTSATSASKLNSYGGATEKISRMLLRDIDSSVSEKSAIAVSEQIERYFQRKVANIFKGQTQDDIAAAISINRGKQITKDTPQNIINLSKDIKNYLDEFKELAQNSGFFAKQEIADYFPRVLDWGKINSSPAEARKFEQTLVSIFKSLKYKNPEKAAKNYIAGHKISGDSVFNREILVDIFGKQQRKKLFGSPGDFKDPLEKGAKGKFVYTPVTDHLTHQRSLQGPYKLVEEVLEKGGYLVNDGQTILNNIINRSSKSIAFARQFGTNGELLRSYFQQIKNKYNPKVTGLSDDAANTAAINEANLVADTIDAYFDRYGKRMNGSITGVASILATLSNLNMLGRVTISSLGDLIQPLQNSAQWSSIIRGFRDTALRAKSEKGAAKALNLDINDNMNQALFRAAGMDKGDITMAAQWMGEKGTRKVNDLLFKGLGLQWLTGYARRFAYNTGVADSFYLSKQLSKVIKSKGTDSNQAMKIKTFLKKAYNINEVQALQIAQSNSINQAIKISTNKKLLNNAGLNTANRDALIPQVSNRLIFTQSQNPAIRVWGQFLSWAMAKSAQTNKILQRIENGNAKQLVKMLAVIPLYSGVQSLREIVKYGEVVTDYDEDNKRWWAEGGRLSGLFGWLPELVANRTIGPGSREPFYAFAPFIATAGDVGKAAQKLVTGKFDEAGKIISQRLAPLPTWRSLLSKVFSGTPDSFTISPSSFDGGKIQAFNKGDVVDKDMQKQAEENMKEGFPIYTNEKGERITREKMEKEIEKESNMKIKDAAKAAAVVGTMAVSGVNADVAKAQDNFLLPKEKSKVVVEKYYDDVSPLEKNKKNWLFNTAELVYKTNKSNPELNSIILAMNSEETGWGTSGFLEKGSNNLFNIQVFDKNEPHIKAKGSNAMVKKYNTPEDSVKDFLNMVNNSSNYEKVRETIEAFKKGNATKSDIVDAIQATGWAENPKWASNVKSILKRRIDGKNKAELDALYKDIFVDKE